MSYFNVEEVDFALAVLADHFSPAADLIVLPNKTHEGRTSHALRVGVDDPAKATTAILLTGSIHAREWGGAEICVFFAADLLDAHAHRTGLQYGGRFFGPEAIESLMATTQIFVFPCVNPDGRKFDQENDKLWRKNRRTAGVPSGSIGVDNNRNFDFVWDFEKTFDPAAGEVASAEPKDDLYHGPAPQSEPETRNVVFLLDTFPQIRWFMDIHCFAGRVLYTWGDDENQESDATMAFHNQAFDGDRGRDVDGYREFIPHGDHVLVKAVATEMANAINAVRGQSYQAVQSFFLDAGNGLTYPTSGTSDDYSYSRHFTDPARPKIYSFATEFGVDRGTHRDSFHPEWEEMEKIVADVDSGLLQFCLSAAAAQRSLRRFLVRNGQDPALGIRSKLQSTAASGVRQLISAG